MSIQVPFQRSRFHSSKVLPLFALATLVIQVLLLLMVFFQGSQLNQLASQPTPTMLQTVDGRVIQGTLASSDYRSLLVVREFVNQWALLNYTWSGKLPPQQSPDHDEVDSINSDTTTPPLSSAEQFKKLLSDEGIKIDGGHKVPTVAANASFLITDDDNFRIEYLKSLSNIVPPGVLGGNQQTVVHISKTLPRQTGQGQWDVKLYGYLEVLDLGQPVGNPVKLIQKISLRAVPPPSYPLENSLSPLQQAIYRLGVAGLEITHIEDLPN